MPMIMANTTRYETVRYVPYDFQQQKHMKRHAPIPRVGSTNLLNGLNYLSLTIRCTKMGI